jgi:tetratricopeptide (TPR) repeat protein
VLRHLLEACPTCRSELAGFTRSRRRLSDAGNLIERTLQMARQHLARVERLEVLAAAELKHLLELPAPKRRLRVGRSFTRFKNPVLVDLILEESRRRVTASAFEALELADLAHDVALRLSHREIGASWAMTCLARAKAYRANALRASGDFHRADSLLDSAVRMFEQDGSADPLVEGELLELSAVLRREQRRFAEAEVYLDAASAIYGRLGDAPLAARVLVLRGFVLFEAGEPERALEPTIRAAASMEPEADPKLYLCAQHNIADFLQEAGRFHEAIEHMRRIAPLYERFPDPWTQLRRQWVAGKTARGLGRYRQAEEALLLARAGFIAEGLGFDSALVGLDLALLFVEEGRTAEVRRLAEEMVPIFMAQDVQREAAAALLLFQEAARREAVSSAMLGELISHMRWVRTQPQQRPF